MTREQDVQAVIRAIEATPEALELRSRVAAAIRNRGKADPAGVEQEALKLCAEAAWAVLDSHPEIAYLLAPPPRSASGRPRARLRSWRWTSAIGAERTRPMHICTMCRLARMA
jgi:hypothetical protein